VFEQTWNFADIVGTIVSQSVRNDFTGAGVDREGRWCTEAVAQWLQSRYS